MIVGVSDGYGGNTWRKTGLAEVKDELSRCKNVKRIIYSNANGDPQKANSDINSMVAQGINVLIMLPDLVPYNSRHAIGHESWRSGCTVSPQIPGVAGTRLCRQRRWGHKADRRSLADWLEQRSKREHSVPGGSPGAAGSQNFMDGLKAVSRSTRT